MSQIEWEDKTSYRYGEKKKPRVWTCRLSESISLSVHNHIYYGEEWLLTSRELGIDKVQLGVYDGEEAKAKAVEYMTEYLTKKQKEIQSAIEKLKT